MGDGPLVFNKKEAADILKICQNTLDQMIANGSIKVVRAGRRVLIPKKSLEALMDSAK